MSNRGKNFSENNPVFYLPVTKSWASILYVCEKWCHYSETRRRSESAHIRQVNFLQLLYRVWEGAGAPLKPSL